MIITHKTWSSAWVRPQAKRPLQIRILREAGGLGDVIVCLPALRWLYDTFCRQGVTGRGLEALGYLSGGLLDSPPALGEPCELAVYGFGPYRKVWEMSGVPFVWRSQQHHDAPSRRERWADPDLHYKEDPDQFLLSVDCWCPFWLHEIDPKAGFPHLSRLQIASLCAGMREDEIATPAMTPPAEAMTWARQWLQFAGWAGEPIALLFPRSQGKPRIWPVERWAAVARGLWREGVRTIIVDERSWHTAWWLEHAKEFQRLHGLSWPQAAALMSMASLSLSGDTGPYHLAAAVGTRAVGVFGLSSGEILSRHYPLARWVQGGLGREIETAEGPAHCRAPCFHRQQNGFGGDDCYDQGCASLNRIEPDQVVAVCLEQLASAKLARRGVACA